MAKGQKDAGTENVSQGRTPETGLPEGFRAIQDHRPMYKCDDCDRSPIRGYLLGVQEMNPTKGQEQRGPWKALVVRLTADCPAVTAEGEIELQGPGIEIIISGIDNAALFASASDPLVTMEVILTPGAKVKTSAGSMNLFNKAVLSDKNGHPILIKRADHGLFFFGKGLLSLSPKQEQRVDGQGGGNASMHDGGASLPVS